MTENNNAFDKDNNVNVIDDDNATIDVLKENSTDNADVSDIKEETDNFGDESDSEPEVPELDSIESDDFSDDWDDETDNDEETDEQNDDDNDDFADDLPEELRDVVADIQKQSANSDPSDIDDAVPNDAEVDTAVDNSQTDENGVRDDNVTQDETVDESSVSDDDLIDETDEVVSENIDEDYSDLENTRSTTESIDADFVDLSYLKDLKQKQQPRELTEQEIKDQKKKLAEERKRKRKEENDLFARRYKAKSINAAVAQTNPIIYFYNAVLDRKANIKLFNVYQVLQDRFLGKLVPQLWMAVAESTDRVLELNLANLLEQMKICAEYPTMDFVITMSTRFFTKPAVLQKLLDAIDKPVENLVMAFDCISLQNLGNAAKTGLGQLKSKNVKIILDNVEKVSMTTLSELDFDYLRLDSRYYELGNFKSEGFLRLLTNFAKDLGIPTIATFCDSIDMVEYMLYMGVDFVQGNAVSRPMRTVPNAVKAITPVESMTLPDE